MYVCICKAVTDSRIRHSVQERGACTLRDLRNELGVGTGCGKCVPHAYEVLTACVTEKAAASSAPKANPVYRAHSA